MTSDSPKTALILGTLHGQVDAMTLLQERGWHVAACGHRRDGPGVDVADEFHLVDITDVDAIASLAKRVTADVVYSVGSDIAMPTVAAVSDRLGLPSFHSAETTETLHRKVLLRAFLDTHELSPVAFRVLRTEGDVDDWTRYPAILKPSDSQGQRGITRVDDPEAARRALPAALAASATETALIEEFLGGPEISVHVFVVDGVVRFLLPSDRHVWAGPLMGIPLGHGLPARFMSDEDRKPVEQLIRSVVSALRIGTGPLYFQLKLTERGPRIIEIAPRLDGCHLWRLIEQHTGFNILERCFDMLVGGTWVDPSPWDDDPGHTLWFSLGDPSSAFRREDFTVPEGRVLYAEIQVDDGMMPRNVNDVVSRLGYAIVEDRR